MDLRLKLFLFSIWIIILLFFIKIAKSKKADIKYIIPWFFLDFGLCIVTACPNILVKLSRIFGIEMPSNMLFFVGMVFLTVIVCYLTISISKLNSNIKDLAQQIALNEIGFHREDKNSESEDKHV